MESYIFCKIIAGDIPSSRVYEDGQVPAFLDISQTTKGYTLLAPKKHIRNILTMSQEISEILFARLPKVVRAAQKATGVVGIDIPNNDEEVVGQAAFHAHVHLISHYDTNDEITFAFTEHEPDFEAFSKLVE